VEEKDMRQLRIRRAGVLTAVVALLLAAGAYAAVIPLPAFNTQVNNDPAAGIDPQQDAGASDIVGGSLVAGGPRVPWATFEQKSGSSQQIFVRAFKNGQWVTQGRSLNISPDVEAEEPSIDFAGAGRNGHRSPVARPCRVTTRCRGSRGRSRKTIERQQRQHVLLAAGGRRPPGPRRRIVGGR
jgi:hypothetical protein